MTSLSFPDVNVWLALLLEHHVHRPSALAWWTQTDSDAAFTRLTQMSVLRLLTTAATMDGQPLTMVQAWLAYDRLFEDERVYFIRNRPASKRRFGSFQKRRPRRPRCGPMP